MSTATDLISSIAPIALIGVAGYFIFRKLGLLGDDTTKNNKFTGITTPIGNFGISTPDDTNVNSGTGTTTQTNQNSIISELFSMFNPLNGTFLSIQSLIDLFNAGRTNVVTDRKAATNINQNNTLMTPAYSSSGRFLGLGNPLSTFVNARPSTFVNAQPNSYASGDITPSFWV